MLRILFMEKCENTKTNNFKALHIAKIILEIVKLNVLLMIVPLMEVSYLLQNYFKSAIKKYRGFRI